MHVLPIVGHKPRPGVFNTHVNFGVAGLEGGVCRERAWDDAGERWGEKNGDEVAFPCIELCAETASSTMGQSMTCRCTGDEEVSAKVGLKDEAFTRFWLSGTC